MLWPAESIYNDTWGSEHGPVEVQWVELMLAYKWTWEALQRTPPYVRRVCWDFLVARRQAAKDANRTG